MTRRCPAPLRQRVLAAVCGLFTAAGAGAQAGDALADLPLDSLLDMPVTGVSRFVQRRSQAAAAVSVVTREEIRAHGHRTLSDVLRGLRGVVITTDRTYDYLGVRGNLASGDYNTRVLLLIDGNRVNDPLYDQAFIGSEFPLDLDAVERVEFIPGSGSAVYGGNALYGVVNVITREAGRERGGSAAATLGSGGERRAQAAMQLPLGDGGLQIAASRELRRGTDLFDAFQAGVNGSDGITRGTDRTQRSALWLRWDAGPLTASLVHAERLRSLPFGVGLVYGDPSNRYRDTSTLLNLERRWEWGESTGVVGRMFAGAYRFDGNYAIDFPPPTLNHDDGIARWHGLEARVTTTRFAGHHLVAGGEWQVAPELRQRNVDLAPTPATHLDDRRSATRIGLYAEDQWRIASAWTLHLGARADRLSGLGWQTSPRVAATWAPSPAWAFKLIHGNAFRPPNAYESAYQVDTPAGYLANPALRTERTRGRELAVEWRPQPAWRLSGSLFDNQTHRLLLQGYDPAIDRYQFANAGVLGSHGIELEAEQVLDGLRWHLNLTLARPSASNTDGAGMLFPRRMLKGGAVWQLPGEWTLAVEAIALSRRGTAPGHALLDVAWRGRLPGSGSATDSAPEIGFGLRNLFDRRAADPGADALRQPVIELPGRTWWLQARWPWSV